MGTLCTHFARRGVKSPHFFFIPLFVFILLNSTLWAQTPPVFDGLFFADGDDSKYEELYTDIATRATAYYFIDEDNNLLYIACVVSTDVNDNVFADTDFSTGDVNYLKSVGWTQGVNKAKDHSVDKLITSDHLEIRLTLCGVSYEWSHDYIYDSDTNPTNHNWLSGYSGPDGGGVPPAGIEEKSSLQWDLNFSSWDPTAGGLRSVAGNGKYSWISPATLISGIPQDFPQQYGWPIFDNTHGTGWEWPLVYEMRIPLTEEQQNCPIGIEFLTAHNSPPKDGLPDTPVLHYDFGDAPDSYITTLTYILDSGNNIIGINNDGARHNIPINAVLWLGTNIDAETNGQPSTGADGDDLNGTPDDEDGVDLPDIVNACDVITISVVSTGTGILNAWIDWNGNGVFDASEALTVGGSTNIAVSAGTNEFDVTVPCDAAQGVTYARFRLSSAGGLQPYGYAADGEVEDYKLSVEPPIEIGLISFGAQFTHDAILINWLVANETNNAGYNIYRSTSSDGNFEKVNENLIPAGTSGSINNLYEYLDTNVNESTYFYKLENINLDGQSTWHGPIQSTIASDVESSIDVPTVFDLARNYPNPFNPVTSISYALPECTDMQLVIYDVQGKRIRTLVSGEQAAGVHSVVWDGTNDSGEFVSSGIYLYRMTAGDFTKTERMTLLK